MRPIITNLENDLQQEVAEISQKIDALDLIGKEKESDVNNGLLLCPNHDSLFDKKLITFDDNGCILISKKLDERNRAFLNVREGMHIEMCNENRKSLTSLFILAPLSCI